MPRINFMDRNRSILLSNRHVVLDPNSRVTNTPASFPGHFVGLGMRLLTSNTHHPICNLPCCYTQVKVSLSSHLFLDGHHHAVQLWQQCVSMEHGQSPDRQQPFTFNTPVLAGDILHCLTQAVLWVIKRV